MLWAIVHVFLLVGFENRILVTMQWVWRYLTYQSGARLITTPAGKSMPRRRVDSPVSPPAGGATAGG